MNDDFNELPSRPGRRCVTAVVLSILTMGVGHIYAGRGAKGVVLFAIGFLAAPTMVLLAFIEPSKGTLYTFVSLPAIVLLIQLYAIVDSGFAASKAARPFTLKAYNNVGLYTALIVLGLLLTIGGTVVVRSIAFEAFHLPTASNEPTFRPGDRILVNKQAFTAAGARRGQMVVFIAPGEGNRKFIKRIVGLPGETIRITDGDVFIDGKEIPREPLEGGEGKERGDDGWYRVRRARIELPETKIPAGHLFMLGDNRPNSHDSRGFGPVPVRDVLGVAQYRFFPIDRLGLVQ